MLGALACFLLGQNEIIHPAILVLMPLFFSLGVLFERGLAALCSRKNWTRATYSLNPGHAGVIAMYRRRRPVPGGWWGWPYSACRPSF